MIGSYWDDATIHMIDFFYGATGMYFDALGKVDEEMSAVVFEHMYDSDLDNTLKRKILRLSLLELHFVF